MTSMGRIPDPEYFNLKVMFCCSCKVFLPTAVTGSCGHTRCILCFHYTRQCPCGEDEGALTKDYLVNSLLEQVTGIENSLWFTLHSYLTNQHTPDPEKESIISAEERYLMENIDPLDMIYYRKFSHEVLIKYLYWLKVFPQEVVIVLYALFKHRCQLWAANGFLDCSVCMKLLYKPVTIPCGHTFCRSCLERGLDFSPWCPFCKRNLDQFNIDVYADNMLLTTAVRLSGAIMNAYPTDGDDCEIFALESDIKFPCSPCYYLATTGTQKFMFRKCSRSQNRMFAVIKKKRMIGTLMLLKDIIKYPDGNLMITSYGLQRIDLTEVRRENGCLVVTYQRRIDIEEEPRKPILLLAEVMSRNWCSSLDLADQAKAQQLFGTMQTSMTEFDGPHWLWWMGNVLPMSEALRDKYMQSTISERCHIVINSVLAWDAFRGPKRFADIDQANLRLNVSYNFECI